jgi:NAD(P)-dependent dehydrogenase (short-subunit alcohol dehydrogenase family)
MNKPVPVPAEKIKAKQLNNRVYLVTGATGGLGRETSMALAKLGATVILTGRNEDKLNRLYDDIEQAGYPIPAIIPFDLEQTDEQTYTQLIESIYNEFKQLDGIAHVACKLGVIGPIASQDAAEWIKVQQINLNACFLLNKVSLPLLAQSGEASITFVSDSSARHSKAYWGAYGVSKKSVESFASMLADELEGSSVNCNVFIPGPSILPIRKKTHPGEENANLQPAASVAEAALQVILSKDSGKIYEL